MKSKLSSLTRVAPSLLCAALAVSALHVLHESSAFAQDDSYVSDGDDYYSSGAAETYTPDATAVNSSNEVQNTGEETQDSHDASAQQDDSAGASNDAGAGEETPAAAVVECRDSETDEVTEVCELTPEDPTREVTGRPCGDDVSNDCNEVNDMPLDWENYPTDENIDGGLENTDEGTGSGSGGSGDGEPAAPGSSSSRTDGYRGYFRIDYPKTGEYEIYNGQNLLVRKGISRNGMVVKCQSVTPKSVLEGNSGAGYQTAAPAYTICTNKIEPQNPNDWTDSDFIFHDPKARKP